MKENMIIKEGDIILKINPEMYPLETIYSAAYVFLDKAYILLDGDKTKEILVKIKPKNEKEDLEKLGGEFLNELINYADYKNRAKNTKEVRELIMQRALFTNDPSLIPDEEDIDFDELLEDLEDDDHLDDPEGIAIPWEEKYGKKKDEKK